MLLPDPFVSEFIAATRPWHSFFLNTLLICIAREFAFPGCEAIFT